MSKAILYFSPYNGAAINIAGWNKNQVWTCPYTGKPLNKLAVDGMNLNFGLGSGPQELRAAIEAEVAPYEAEIVALLEANANPA